MSAAARKPASRPSAREVFIARAKARALLWQLSKISLHEAVDELQTAAERDGLVAKLGQDAVQRLMAAAFAAVRNLTAGARESADNDDAAVRNLTAAAESWSAPSWHAAALAYHRERGKRASIVEIEPERLKQLRALMADDVALECAFAEVNQPAGVAREAVR